MPQATAETDKKQDIVRWATERFYEGGFHATGVDTMLAGSGISKRTLYKYFPSKEDLIEAVLDHYGEGVAQALFKPAMAASDNPRAQIMAFFDIRKALFEQNPARGCLGMKAGQEYLDKHDGIAAHARNAATIFERHFIKLCERAHFPRPTRLGKQINILFQGAVLLSQTLGDPTPYTNAKAAVATLMGAA